MHDHRPLSFFVLRSPLLPFETMLEWSAAGPDENALLARLREIARRPEVAEAVLLASDELAAAAGIIPSGAPDSQSGERRRTKSPALQEKRALLALSRYLCRMTSRATPFGLFAGCSVGELADETKLELPPLEQYTRSTAPGIDLLVQVAESLDEETRARAPLVPTTTRYELAGQLRYVEERGVEHPLRAARAGRELRTALRLAEQRLNAGELAEALAGELRAPVEGARRYVGQLVANQILIPDLRPRVTAHDPTSDFAARLHAIEAAPAKSVDALAHELRRIDEQRIGAADYAPLRRELEAIAPGKSIADALLVVLNKPAAGLSLDRRITDGVLDAAELLQRLFGRAEMDPLHKFRETFLSRYETRFVPLLEALDDELGIGLMGFGDAGIDDMPLLKDVPLRAEPKMPTVLPVHRVLLEKVGHVLRDGGTELVIERGDVERMALQGPLPLPASFAAIGTITADAQFALTAVSGPSGAQFIGRFCHCDARMERAVREWLRDEERLDPDAIYAEVVALPDGRDANVVARPAFTEHEIPFLGTSSRPREQQIDVSDLLVGVKDGRLRLWSRSRNREVAARVTNAHNFRGRGVSAYRFLGALQRQRVAGSLYFDWGPLYDLPFLPRVRYGNVILSRARWNLEPDELKPLRAGAAEERLAAARALVARRGLPRFVVLTQGDNDLLIDWENIVTIDAFVAIVKERVTLQELVPSPDRLAVHGPEGSFTGEVVLPFVRREPRARPKPLPVTDTPREARLLPPGGEWIYWKIYTGYSTADRILADTIAPAMQRLRDEGRMARWFFIRYGDPDFHLRLRVRALTPEQGPELLRELSLLFAPLFADRWIARLQLDTYNREVERYGGIERIETVEAFFEADSAAVVKVLPLVGDPALRWQVAAYGGDRLLGDLGLDEDAKLALYEQLTTDFGRELGDERVTRDALAKKTRAFAPQLEAAFANEARLPWKSAFDERSRAVRALPLVLDRQAPFLDGIAASLLHMHLNRVFRAEPRAQERVLYDLMYRRCRSRKARAVTVGGI